MSLAKDTARYAQVIVDVPMAQPLDYALGAASECANNVGLRCVVPLGRRTRIGIVVGVSDQPSIDPAKVKPIARVLDETAPLSPHWLQLTRFAAEYYQHPWGEVALPALPRALRSLPGPRYAQSIARLRERPMARWSDSVAPRLDETAEQLAAIEALTNTDGFAPHLLFGVTGSGKTEIYLAAIARRLASSETAQALLLVPEINLTPQLEALLRARFPGETVVALHSSLAEAERAAAWLAAHEGRARIVVGTRLAVFASMPQLAIIVVDEEHDPSYKAGEGVRYSARDLAVKRAQLLAIPVVLGSATPSLETWAQARSGRYRLMPLTQRVGAEPGARTWSEQPAIELIDARVHEPQNGLSAPITRALTETLERGEQSLVFLNRRGYTPVVTCEACGWLSHCPRCSTFAVFHKPDRTLRCHHCGYTAPVPRACPTCGNQQLKGVGQGTQRIEETLQALLPAARISRIDRDSTRQRHAAKEALDAVHAGVIDVLVGTQMIAKGHDFQRVSLVVVLNPDGQLASHDFRAPERLFSTLMQVAGRAGRAGLPSRVLVQTRFAAHPLFAALVRRDYAQFAEAQLAERAAAHMPPLTHQALLTAEARTMDAALGFLRKARAAAPSAQASNVRLFDPVPMALQRLAGVARAQLLIEADQRTYLHTLLDAWLAELRAQRTAVRWNVEVDPLQL